jgi:hypothetical protein
MSLKNYQEYYISNDPKNDVWNTWSHQPFMDYVPTGHFEKPADFFKYILEKWLNTLPDLPKKHAEIQDNQSYIIGIRKDGVRIFFNFVDVDIYIPPFMNDYVLDRIGQSFRPGLYAITFSQNNGQRDCQIKPFDN